MPPFLERVTPKMIGRIKRVAEIDSNFDRMVCHSLDTKGHRGFPPES